MGNNLKDTPMPRPSNVNQGMNRRIESVDTVRVSKKIIDEAIAGTTYIGEAQCGSALGNEVWQIMKIVEAASVTTITWAEGNGNYDKEWNERANYEYR